MKYLLGIIFIGIGFLVVWKSQWFVENFGAIDFAEEKLASYGGTAFFYKLIGIGIIILSFVFMAGGIGPILTRIFVPKAQNI